MSQDFVLIFFVCKPKHAFTPGQNLPPFLLSIFLRSFPSLQCSGPKIVAILCDTLRCFTLLLFLSLPFLDWRSSSPCVMCQACGSSLASCLLPSAKSNILNMAYKTLLGPFSVHLPSLILRHFPLPTLLSSHTVFLLLPLRSHTLMPPNT